MANNIVLQVIIFAYMGNIGLMALIMLVFGLLFLLCQSLLIFLFSYGLSYYLKLRAARKGPVFQYSLAELVTAVFSLCPTLLVLVSRSQIQWLRMPEIFDTLFGCLFGGPSKSTVGPEHHTVAYYVLAPAILIVSQTIGMLCFKMREQLRYDGNFISSVHSILTGSILGAVAAMPYLILLYYKA